MICLPCYLVLVPAGECLEDTGHIGRGDGLVLPGGEEGVQRRGRGGGRGVVRRGGHKTRFPQELVLPDDELLGGGEDGLLGPGQGGGGQHDNSEQGLEHPAGTWSGLDGRLT